MEYNEFYKAYNDNLDKVAQMSKNFPWDNKEAYATWIANTHYYVKESSLMLALAASNLPAKHKKAANRFIRHAGEEMGHEFQLEKDLKELGYKGVDPLTITNEMKICHRSLSYWGQQSENAIGFMGWVLLVEGLAVKVGGDLFLQINKNYGGKGTNFLRSHSDDDPEHLEEAYTLLKRLDASDLSIVLDSLTMYTDQYISFLASIIEKFSIASIAA